MAQPVRFKQEVVARLRYLIELRGTSVTAIERELGRSRGYLGDALRGDKRMSLDILVETLGVLGTEPREFFIGQTPEEARWTGVPHDGREVAERAAPAELAAVLVGRPPSTPPGRGELLRLVRAITALLLEKGLITLDELRSAVERS